ncbi:MAG: LytR/AlgR family response regulator transcription factor, partial [Pseudomonadota bacterium]
LWEGEASLCRGDEPIPLHLTLVADTRTDGPEPGLLLALMVPRGGMVEVPAGRDPTTTGSEVPRIEPTSPALQRLAVPLYQETRFLDPTAITHLGADGHYTRIHGPRNVLLASQPLGSFEAELPDCFLRVHRSFVVNLAHVDALLREDGGHALRLDDTAGTLIPVSRRRLALVQEQLGTTHAD